MATRNGVEGWIGADELRASEVPVATPPPAAAPAAAGDTKPRFGQRASSR